VQDLLRGVWRENPTLVQLMGLCPTLAVTNSVANCLAMGTATMFVLVGSGFLVSLVRKWVPSEIRISTYVLIIATFVTVADLALAAVAPAVHRALGAFVALIVVNCIILGRAEAFASRNTVGRSVLDATGMGIGFTWVMLVMGSVREVLGSGTWLGIRVFGESFEPWVIMVLPPGGVPHAGLDAPGCRRMEAPPGGTRQGPGQLSERATASIAFIPWPNRAMECRCCSSSL
jgi:electron transport complex protein RnfE